MLFLLRITLPQIYYISKTELFFLIIYYDIYVNLPVYCADSKYYFNIWPIFQVFFVFIFQIFLIIFLLFVYVVIFNVWDSIFWSCSVSAGVFFLFFNYVFHSIWLLSYFLFCILVVFFWCVSGWPNYLIENMHVFLLLSFPGFWLSAYIGVCLSEFIDLFFYRCTGFQLSGFLFLSFRFATFIGICFYGFTRFLGFWFSGVMLLCFSGFLGLRVSCSGVFQEMDKIKDVYMKRVIYVKQIFQAAAFFSIV